jgi:hypothetical protein
MSWRDLADKLDQVTVATFDEGGVTLQKMAAGVPSGAPIPLPAEFDAAFVEQSVEDGLTVATTRPAAWIHYADLEAASPGTVVVAGDRLIVAAPSPNAGTYSIDSIEPNSDRTGAMLRLKVSQTR